MIEHLYIGVIVLFVGHFIGPLTPINVFDRAGIAPGAKQLMSLVGRVAGVAARIGATLLPHRRPADPCIRRSSWSDIAVLVPIWLQLVMGVGTACWTMQHLDGSEMVRFMGWASTLVTFNPDAPSLLSEVATIYKFHIILRLILFTITPSARLVHIWSIPLGYLIRPGHQIVRSLAPIRRRAKGPLGGAPNPGGTTVLRRQAKSGQPGA